MVGRQKPINSLKRKKKPNPNTHENPSINTCTNPFKERETHTTSKPNHFTKTAYQSNRKERERWITLNHENPRTHFLEKEFPEQIKIQSSKLKWEMPNSMIGSSLKGEPWKPISDNGKPRTNPESIIQIQMGNARFHGLGFLRRLVQVREWRRPDGLCFWKQG